MKLINHICYHVNLDHLIEHYVSLNYYMDTVVVVHNPSNYANQLRDLGLSFDGFDSKFDKIMVVLVETVQDGVRILNELDPSTGPYCSLWYNGEKISDNIEEELRFGT
jgi:hypothetical protein